MRPLALRAAQLERRRLQQRGPAIVRDRRAL